VRLPWPLRFAVDLILAAAGFVAWVMYVVGKRKEEASE
jgi:hypothetical protein